MTLEFYKWQYCYRRNTVIGDWVSTGYDAMDGMVPTCYQFSIVATIKVMPVFDD